MMDLLERYLHAVRGQLPLTKADDIADELREGLLARQEDREEALGRPLTASETSSLIKEFGHPLVVAGRYRPQQSLIGPDVLPFYLFVLRILVVVMVAIQVAVAAARTLFAQQPFTQAFAQMVGGLSVALVVSVGAVTIIFALLERAGFPADHLRRWNPEQLPDVRDEPRSTWEIGLEIGAGVAFLLWWGGAIDLPYAANAANFRMEPAAVLVGLYWPIMAFVATRLVLNLIAWARPRWRLFRAVATALTTIAGLALLTVIYRAGEWVMIVPDGMPVTKAAEIAAAVNFALRIGLVALGATCAWQGVAELWRLVREWRR